ncbi:FtsX-like permease family protein [Bifidobacterium sp. ESL0728]|uniref:FtsX-like permease family protein n=1 Tax=Bifidobacterium sp. ESL0728 TaxID=2983220 RepID=UPI0023F7CC3A|nr:FtsX-like permease family protein [Bifidobacterium sp. ESL0728]WEV58614.1 FtsX-like permease family protein [Bifidobacterium sp. ESL0728]
MADDNTMRSNFRDEDTVQIPPLTAQGAAAPSRAERKPEEPEFRGSKRMLWHDIWQAFSKSKGRFFSIVLLVALGSFALVGLTVSGPDMRDTGNAYFAEHHLADLSVISSYGLDKADRQQIDKAPGASRIEYGYLKDVVVRGSDESVRVLSAPKDVSTYHLVSGRMPKTAHETVIDSKHQGKYPIGSTLKLTEKPDALGRKVLRHDSFKVVGVVDSTEIFSSVNLGPSTSGSGSLDGYAVVTPGAFKFDDYMIARLTYTDLDRMRDHYSSKYNDALQVHKKALDKILAGRPKARRQAIENQVKPQIDSGRQRVDDAKQQLDSARQQLSDGKTQLDNGNQQLAASKQQLATQVATAKKQIAAANAKIAQGQKEYDASKQQYDAGAAQIASATQQVNDAYTQLKAGQAQIDGNSAKLAAGKKQADDAVAQVAAAQQSVNQGITTLQGQIDAINKQLQSGAVPPSQQTQLTAERDQLNTQLQQLQAQAQVVAQKSAEATQGRDAFINGTYNPGIAQIQAAQAQLNAKRTQADAGDAQLQQKQQQLAAAKTKLDQAATQLAQARAKVQQSQQQLATKQQQAQAQIDAAQTELTEKTNEYNTKKTQFDQAEPDAQRKINDAEQKLNDATAMLNAVDDPVYSVDSKRETPGSDGYKIYDSISVIVDSLSHIFPYFMYLVAALVTFTTMTRFVDEERIDAGTLKGLGYSDRDVMKKFVVYGFIASILGAIIGIVTGHTLLPVIVYNAYKVGFNVPMIHLGFHWQVTLLAVVLAMLSAVVPAVWSAARELKERPAALMLPKPPSAGSKILLERIPFIWNHLNFTHKVTARNIFRYKQRMFMTIFGVCGSVALLTAGFAVQGSISAINQHQFVDVMHYNLIAAENAHVTDSQNKAIGKRLEKPDIKRSLPVHYESITKVAGRNGDKQSVTMLVPKNTSTFNDYIKLDTRQGHHPLSMESNGAIISERLANLVHAKKGDTIDFQNGAGKTYRVKVTGICEMYLGHFMVMSPSAYRSVFGQRYQTNAYMVTLKDGSMANTKRQAASFMRLGGIQGVVQNTTLMHQIDVVVKALNQIMWVLIIVATMLGVVILYNLTNLNVSERVRELSTIKVLGFYNGETTMYIYRETILLSILGIFVGYGFGAWLHRYIITAVPPDDVMFDPSITWLAFVVPVVVVGLITAALGWFVNSKLKRLDMLEALKSVD